MMSLHRKLTGFYTFLVLLNAGSWLALIVAGMVQGAARAEPSSAAPLTPQTDLARSPSAA